MNAPLRLPRAPLPLLLLALTACGRPADLVGPPPAPDPQVARSAVAARQAALSLQTANLYVDMAGLVGGDAGFGELYSGLLGDEDGALNPLGAFSDLAGGAGGFGRAPRNLVPAHPEAWRMLRGAQEDEGEGRNDPPQLSCEAGTTICTIVVTTHFDRPASPIARVVQTIVYDTRGTPDEGDDVALGYSATRYYRDGSVEVVATEDLDEDGELRTGAARIVSERTWPQGEPDAEGAVARRFELWVVLNTPEFDADDVVFGITGEIDFADGRWTLEGAQDLQTDPAAEGYRDLHVGLARYRQAHRFPAGYEHPEGLSELELIVDLYLNEPENDADDVWTSMTAHKTFADGSTAVATAEDLDGDAVLTGGTVRYVEEREWAEGAENDDDLSTARVTVESDIGEEGGEEDDLLLNLRMEAEHRDGTRTEVTIEPDAPVPHGHEPTGGTVRARTVFPEDAELVRAERVLTGAEGVVTVTDEVEYRNGSAGVDRRTVRIHADGRGEVEGALRDGTTYAGAFDQRDGSFSVTYTAPEGSPIASVTESGRIRESGQSAMGELSRVVELRDGTRLVSRVRIAKTGKTTRLTILEDPSGGSGAIVVHEGRFFTRVVAEWTDAAGNTARVHARRYLAGHGTLDVELDDASTPQDPDVSGRIHVRPDGSGRGVLTVHGPGGETQEIRVFFDGFGRGSAIDEMGGEASF